MKSSFLTPLQKTKQTNEPKKLIVFFNGWSVDENIINHFAHQNYDVIMFYDYSDLNIDENLLNKINLYDEINVVAWSFGVWACGCVIDKFKTPKNVIAINGTLLPIDKEFGIPEKMFTFTLSTLSEKTYPLFFKNMFLDEADANKKPSRTIENQKRELEQIQKLSYEKKGLQNIDVFTKVIIGLEDKIIPAKNQINFWSQNSALDIIKIDKGHYVFDLFKNWDDIINYE